MVINMKKTTRIIWGAVIGTVLTAVSYYIVLPPINVHSTEFWIWTLFVLAFYAVPLGLFGGISLFQKKSRGAHIKLPPVLLILALIPVCLLLIGKLISSPVFNAHKYATVIDVQEAVFAEDMPEADTVTNISLMDTDSAIIIGNRALGALSDVVSQYNLSQAYSQINYQGTPQKVSNLEYVDFFRWINNSGKGIPGYVMVDPVNSSAEYIRFETPMVYVQSAYFHQDLYRKLRFSYPTKIISDIRFEIDEAGMPWYIVSCMSPHVGLFGAMDVSEVIIFNPCTGSSELYSVADTPSWVDNVYNGYLASEKYDWYGTLAEGWINSVIGNRNCKQTTDDFGYIVLGDDVWYFTGVTSVTSDESNIGFIISNARTGEYKYYPVVGAEEYSAMSAAQGEVQEKGYVASFPSLINVSGQATYIMVLKDSGGLVKLYALVNVENYSIVATGSTQTEAKTAYMNLLAQRGLIDPIQPEETEKETVEKTVTVAEVRMAVLNGETVIYLLDGEGTVFKSRLAADEMLITVCAGDRLTVKAERSDGEGIWTLTGWKRLPAAESGENR